MSAETESSLEELEANLDGLLLDPQRRETLRYRLGSSLAFDKVLDPYPALWPDEVKDLKNIYGNMGYIYVSSRGLSREANRVRDVQLELNPPALKAKRLLYGLYLEDTKKPTLDYGFYHVQKPLLSAEQLLIPPKGPLNLLVNMLRLDGKVDYADTADVEAFNLLVLGILVGDFTDAHLNDNCILEIVSQKIYDPQEVVNLTRGVPPIIL